MLALPHSPIPVQISILYITHATHHRVTDQVRCRCRFFHIPPMSPFPWRSKQNRPRFSSPPAPCRRLVLTAAPRSAAFPPKDDEPAAPPVISPPSIMASSPGPAGGPHLAGFEVCSAAIPRPCPKMGMEGRARPAASKEPTQVEL